MNNNEDRNNKPFSFLEFHNVVNSQYPTNEMTSQSDNSSNACRSNGSVHMKMKFQPNLNVARSYDNNNININNVSNAYTNSNNNNTSILADIEKNFKTNNTSSSHQTQRKSSIHHHDKKEQITYQFTQDTFKQHKRPSSPNNNNNNTSSATIHNKQSKTSSTPQTLSSIITNIKSTDPTAYTPILLPFTTPTQQHEQPLLDDSIYLFQFPRQIPFNIPLQDKIKKEETITDEPQYDSNGYLIQPEYQNVFKQLPNHTRLGKLTLYKSGKLKLNLGNVNFTITEGIKTKFAQELAIVNTNDNKAYILGEVVNKKLIVIPEFDI